MKLRYGILDAAQYLPTKEELERARAQYEMYLKARHAELDKEFKEASHAN
jgi:hypothetical protein